MTVGLTSEGQALNCINGGVLVCEASSAFGTHLNYTWSMNNTVVSQDMTYAMTSPGTLDLEVTYPGTSSLLCTDAISMTVVMDTMRFSADAGLPGTVTCDTPVLELMGTTSTSSDASVAWTTEDGDLEGNTDNALAFATSGGTYTMTVTNLSNGCTSSDTVVLSEDLGPTLKL